jgi:hypothetical protein
MNYETQVMLEVSFEADEFYPQAAALGSHAAEALKDKHRSQLTGLENIAESTSKISDIMDYIKKQTARFSHWGHTLARGENAQQGFGERLRAYLENDLAQRRDIVCGRLQIGDSSYEDKQKRRRIYLLLVRQFIRSMVVEYEYAVSAGKNERKEC